MLRATGNSSTLEAQLRAMEAERAAEAQALEERRKELNDQKRAVTKEIRNKRKRDDRIMSKASRNLSCSQILTVAARKLAKEEKRRQQQ